MLNWKQLKSKQTTFKGEDHNDKASHIDKTTTKEQVTLQQLLQAAKKAAPKTPDNKCLLQTYTLG